MQSAASINSPIIPAQQQEAGNASPALYPPTPLQPTMTRGDSKNDWAAEFKHELKEYIVLNEPVNFAVNCTWQSIARPCCSTKFISRSLGVVLGVTATDVIIPAIFIAAVGDALLTMCHSKEKTWSAAFAEYKREKKYYDSVYVGIYTAFNIFGWTFGYTAMQLGQLGFVEMLGNTLLEKIARGIGAAIGTVAFTNSFGAVWGIMRVTLEEAGYLTVDNKEKYEPWYKRLCLRALQNMYNTWPDMPGDFLWSYIDDYNIAETATPVLAQYCGKSFGCTLAVCADAAILSTSVTAVNICTRAGLFATANYVKHRKIEDYALADKKKMLAQPLMERDDNNNTQSSPTSAKI